MSAKLTFERIEAGLEGRLAQEAGELTLAARLDVRSPSLGDVQDVFKLARVVEGTGTLGLALDDALARLAIDLEKMVGETIGLPLHLLGSILGANGQPLPEHKPCVGVPDKEQPNKP